MLKQKQYNLADSNIANLGTDLEKKVRLNAAQGEPEWKTAGKAPGLQIWRVEQFKIKPWPQDQYGRFFTGDSYIVLYTYKKPGSDALHWNVHFWLGTYTTQDEAGTAAYKTVELDDFLGGAPVQYREVQGHESATFLGYFKFPIILMEGGVETGFKHVKPEAYRPRLLHLKGRKKVRVAEVELSHKSLNSGDVFILDAGMKIYQWNGKSAGPFEKSKAAQVSRALDDERAGKPEVIVVEEGSKNDEFWAALGGQGPVKSAEAGGKDDEDGPGANFEKVLYRLSDASGKLSFAQVSKGAAVKRNQLDSSDVFILDTGSDVFAWIGKKASVGERKSAMQYAQQYLTQYNRPLYLTISRVLEGGENEAFEAGF